MLQVTITTVPLSGYRTKASLYKNTLCDCNAGVAIPIDVVQYLNGPVCVASPLCSSRVLGVWFVIHTLSAILIEEKKVN